MHSLPGLQLANVSSSGFVYHERTQFIRRNEFIASAAKAEATVRRKSEEEIKFSLDSGRQCLGPKTIGYGKMPQFSG